MPVPTLWHVLWSASAYTLTCPMKCLHSDMSCEVPVLLQVLWDQCILIWFYTAYTIFWQASSTDRLQKLLSDSKRLVDTITSNESKSPTHLLAQLVSTVIGTNSTIVSQYISAAGNLVGILISQFFCEQQFFPKMMMDATLIV